VLPAEAVEGTLQTTFVLSDEDVEKLRQIAEQTEVLKECRVVIVLSD
jgi:hypothetical protein